jgi:alkanesulfonate monooxygenase SsuD/methylene tetrahydromethanopterin reductase-like flavin-dependent oxidoreductase (luciferase family)
LDHVIRLVDAAEHSGFDSVWVTDRDPVAGEPDPPLEAYSLLGAVASRTTRLRLGVVPAGADRRTPSIVAKTVTGIDVISHGRGILTYGLDGDDSARGPRLIEALRVGRALLEDETPTFSGSFYSVLDARNQPAPVQLGGVPVVISVERLADLTDVAVTEFIGLADAVIVAGDADGLRRIVDEVASALRSPDDGVRRGARHLQVIGVASVPDPADHSSSLQPGEGRGASDLVSSVRDLIDAGVDGCLVPVGLGTHPAVLTEVGRELGDLTGTGGAAGPHPGAR